jgi:hypothetical protein
VADQEGRPVVRQQVPVLCKEGGAAIHPLIVRETQLPDLEAGGGQRRDEVVPEGAWLVEAMDQQDPPWCSAGLARWPDIGCRCGSGEGVRDRCVVADVSRLAKCEAEGIAGCHHQIREPEIELIVDKRA